jgi:hypothetical protein
LYLIVEMENALANEVSFLGRSTTRGENPQEFTPLKVHLLAEAHTRFIALFLDGVLGEELDMLWATTTGLGDRQGHNRWMQRSIQELRASQSAQVARHNHLQEWLEAWRSEKETISASPRGQAIRELCLLITAENQRCFNDLKLAIRTGVQVFEKYEAQVIEQGGTELLTALRQIPQVIQAYYERLADGIQILANRYDLPLQHMHLAEETVTQFIGHGAQMDDDELKKTVPDSE